MTLTPGCAFPSQSWKPVPRLRGTSYPFIRESARLPDFTFPHRRPLLRASLYNKQHYVRLYWTGNRTDCGSPDCLHSMAHRHKTARTCKCNRVRRSHLLPSPSLPFPLSSPFLFVFVVAIFIVSDFTHFPRGGHATEFLFSYVSVRHHRPYMKTAAY